MSGNILAFSGSLRNDSWNGKLVRVAAHGAEAEGVPVTLLKLKDYPLPVFDEDLEREQGLPENVLKLKKLFLEHQGLLIASPEYNSSITAALKNMIDWISRPVPGEKPLVCFDGKVAALMAASPGALGGLRGLVTLRSILGNIKVILLPEQIAIAKAHEAFDAEGHLKESDKAVQVKAIGNRLAQVVKKLNA